MRAGWSKNDLGPGCTSLRAVGPESLPHPHALDRPISARQPRTGLSKHWHLSFAGLSPSQIMCTLTAMGEVSNASDALPGCTKSLLGGLGLHGGSRWHPWEWGLVVGDRALQELAPSQAVSASSSSPPSHCTTPWPWTQLLLNLEEEQQGSSDTFLLLSFKTQFSVWKKQSTLCNHPLLHVQLPSALGCDL